MGCEVMKKIIAVVFSTFGAVLFAAPTAVEIAAEEMLANGVEVKAGSTKEHGVFVVASASVVINDSIEKARGAARTIAQKNLAGFLNTSVSSKDVHISIEDKGAVQEFFHSQTETSIKELLKGIQDLRSFERDGSIVYVVYLTSRGCDKSNELDTLTNAMGYPTVVEAIGEAENRDAALQKALQNAVEQVLGTMIVGSTTVKDFKDVKSKVFAGAQGLVEEYRVKSEESIAPGVRVTVIAKVAKKKLLDSYSVQMKAIGNPVFYLHSDSDELSTKFAQFFVDMGFAISMVQEKADYRIEALGNFREIKHPANGRKGTQLSMAIKVYAIGGSEVLISVANDPRKSSCFIGSLDRQREIVAEKAFKQMEKPVHEAINSMVARMMADHTDKLMNSND